MFALPERFCPRKDFAFPKRKFGEKKGKKVFTAEWCKKYLWLHYDVKRDATLRHLCMRAEHEHKFLASTKRDAAKFNNQ